MMKQAKVKVFLEAVSECSNTSTESNLKVIEINTLQARIEDDSV
jgi:hypothetical protein